MAKATEHDGYAVGGRAEAAAKWEQWSKDLPGDALASARKGNAAGLRAILGEMTWEEKQELYTAIGLIAREIERGS